MDASQPRCLIVEADALLGFALEDDLEEARIAVAGPLGRLRRGPRLNRAGHARSGDP
jgi:hypothetical protein